MMTPFGCNGGAHVTLSSEVSITSTTPGTVITKTNYFTCLLMPTIPPSFDLADASLLGSLVPPPLVAVMVTDTT